MNRGKIWIVAGAIALATGVSGVAATLIDTSGSLTSQAARTGNAQWMNTALAHTKATHAEVQALSDALKGVQLNVDGKTIANFVIAEQVLNNVQKPGLLSTQAALQAAIVKAMAHLALHHLLYVNGVQNGDGVSNAKMKQIEDYETTLATQGHHALPGGQSPYRYFHSATWADQYKADVIVKKMTEKITGTGDIITPSQEPLIASRLHAWAATVFPTTVVITGMPGVTAASLLNVLP